MAHFKYIERIRWSPDARLIFFFKSTRALVYWRSKITRSKLYHTEIIMIITKIPKITYLKFFLMFSALTDSMSIEDHFSSASSVRKSNFAFSSDELLFLTIYTSSTIPRQMPKRPIVAHTILVLENDIFKN